MQEMIADLKADSARWEAEVSRSRPERGSYIHKSSMPHVPNMPPASYPIDVRPPPGPSPPTYSAPPVQTYVDPYAQGSYGAAPSIPYTNAPPTYTSSHAPYVSSQAPYPPYTGASQPAVTASDAVPSYTYTTNTGYGYENNVRNNAPRYTGPAYESEPDYSPVTSGMSYSSTTVPDPRIGMDPRYTPEYSDRSSRTQPAREREARRPR